MDSPGTTLRLRACRQLLRDIQCETVVVDTGNHNLYDILITSENKKIVLLTWLLQTLFGKAHCARSSLEELVSVFMDSSELKSFLDCTMAVESQFDKWLLMFTTVKQMKEQSVTNPRDIIDGLLNRKLLDEYIEFWDRKVVKPSASLLPQDRITNTNIAEVQNDLSATEERLKQLALSSGSNTVKENIADVQNALIGTEERLKQLTLSSGSNTESLYQRSVLNEIPEQESLVEPSVPAEKPEHLTSIFLREYYKLYDRFFDLIRPSFSENSGGINDLERIQSSPELESISEGLLKLREMLNQCDASENSTD